MLTNPYSHIINKQKGCTLKYFIKAIF